MIKEKNLKTDTIKKETIEKQLITFIIFRQEEKKIESQKESMNSIKQLRPVEISNIS